MGLEHELRTVLERATARVQARFGAIALLDPSGRVTELLATGIADAARAEIGALPRGHGMLGALFGAEAPIRIEHLPSDPRSAGVPTGHPLIYGFLGAPVVIARERAGSVYFANREQGVFDEVDERTAQDTAAEVAGILERRRAAVRHQPGLDGGDLEARILPERGAGSGAGARHRGRPAG